MKKRIVTSVIFIIIIAILLAGCTTQTNSNNKNLSNTIQEDTKITDENDVSVSSDLQVKNSGEIYNKKETKNSIDSDNISDERYFYNIRIISPEDLEKINNEKSNDEYSIQNEKGDLIGIVSSKVLYLRGDLINLQQESGKTNKVFEKQDVAEHLIDIVYGNDNAKLNLFKSNKDYQFWLDAYYTKDDTSYLLKLAQLLNSLSDTTQFEDEELSLGFLKTNYEEVPYNFYNIKIIPQNMLDDYEDDRKNGEHLIKDSDGKLIGMVGDDHLYLLDSLTAEERQYYMLYGVLYSMGMHGTTYSEPDSFFYQVGGKMNTELSDLDKEAIKLLYGGRLKTGTDMDDTRKTLGLNT